MIQWDMAMVTAADYTVEFSIPEEAYEKWYLEDYSKENGDKENEVPPAMSLKKALKEAIEETLNEELRSGNIPESLKSKNNESQLESVKIADIQFAFNNHKLIQAL